MLTFFGPDFAFVTLTTEGASLTTLDKALVVT